MKARLVTRCGCQRTIDISAPPPPEIVLPLRPPEVNNGLVRPWMMERAATSYDPKRDGLTVRIFRLSRDSVHAKWGGDAWYDEVTDYDPPSFDAARRTYASEGGKG